MAKGAETCVLGHRGQQLDPEKPESVVGGFMWYDGLLMGGHRIGTW